MKITWLVVLLAAMATPAPPGTAADRPLATVETIVGAWNGRWIAEQPRGAGPMELVVARIPGRDQVVGHFTFVSGAVTRSLRYEGSVVDGRLEFPLVAEGRIVLEPEAAARPGSAERLNGEWTEQRGALPAPEGVMELARVP
jgi:hypothetical protein